MAERDSEFVQDVLRIVYAALSDREALAAAMSGQQPAPVPNAAPSGSSPTELGVQGGAGMTIPPATPYCCARTLHADYEDLAFNTDGEANIQTIMTATGATREEVVQQAMREALQDALESLKGKV